MRISETIRAWFYPGNNFGQEFVYPKRRAVELAVASKAVVPALTVDVAGVDALKTAPIIAVTPEQREVPVEAAIQTTPQPPSQPPGRPPSSRPGSRRGSCRQRPACFRGSCCSASRRSPRPSA